MKKRGNVFQAVLSLCSLFLGGILCLIWPDYAIATVFAMVVFNLFLLFAL